MLAPLNAESQSTWAHEGLQTRSRRTLERILDATERLMAARPFRDISVAEIAREANASLSSLYSRFTDKRTLLGAVYERHASSQRERMAQIFDSKRWKGVPLASILRQTFPLIVAGYRERQGLIRAFLEQASVDVRFRNTWSEMGEFIEARVLQLVMPRSFEINHPHPERGLQLGMRVAFATIAHRIQMHEIDGPQMDELTEELIRMMLRYLGIADVPAVAG
jgi:AcrR family transcriptional regulator